MSGRINTDLVSRYRIRAYSFKFLSFVQVERKFFQQLELLKKHLDTYAEQYDKEFRGVDLRQVSKDGAIQA